MNNPKLQKDIEDFENVYKQVSLSVDEKENLKSRIFSEIKTTAPAPVTSPFFAWNFYFKLAPVALVVFVLVGAPISFAAEKSLPGDVLYKVKTNVNEEVKAVFVPKEEKNEYYQSLLTKRVSEIKILAQEGEIEKEALVDFELALEENVSDVILALEVSEDSEEDTLEDHQVVVAALDISEEVLGLSEEVETGLFSVTVVSKIENKEEPKGVEVVEEKENDKKEMEEKFRSLKNVALDALSKHIEDTSDNDSEKVEPVVEDKVEDIEEKETDGKEEVVAPELIGPPVTVESAIKMRLEREVQILIDGSVEGGSDL